MGTSTRLERRLEARLRTAPSLGSAELLKRAVELVRGRKARRVIDLGTGCAELPACLRAEGLEATGVDLCGSLLARARTDGAPPGTLLQADVERLPFRDGGFDAATLLLILHYLRHPGLALAEVFRILRPGGWLILADRIATSDPIERERQHRLETLRNPSIRRLLTPAELVGAAAEAGFRVRLIDFLNVAIPIGEWLAGVDPLPSARIRRELLRLPSRPDGLSIDSRGRLLLRIDLILAWKPEAVNQAR